VSDYFEFVLPVSKKKVIWKPLTVGRSLDVSAAHRQESMRHMLGTSMLSARIIGFDDKEGSPSTAQMRELDEFDLEAFGEEVEQKEAARKATFRKATLGVDPNAMLDKAIEDAHTATQNLAQALKQLLEMRQLAELSGPLA
jgi:hypothetical protein